MKLSIVFAFSFFFRFRVDASVWHVSPQSLHSVPREHQFRTIQQAVEKSWGWRHGAHSFRRLSRNGDVGRAATRKHRFDLKPRRAQMCSDRSGSVELSGARKSETFTARSGHIDSFPGAKSNAHPDDEYHRLIGRAEQVVMNGNLLQQTLAARSTLTRLVLRRSSEQASLPLPACRRGFECRRMSKPRRDLFCGSAKETT